MIAPVNQHSLYCQDTHLMALIDHPVGGVLEKIAQGHMGAAWQVAQ